MKRNNTLGTKLNDFLNSVIYSDNKKIYFLILSFSSVLFFLVFWFGPGPTGSDTDTNYFAGEVIASGKLDALRTPVYPVMINFFKWLFVNTFAFKIAVIFFQYLIFTLSVICFFRVSEYFISSRTVSFFIVFLYACHPETLIWPKILMPESLAISGVVFLLYFLVQFFKNRRIVNILFVNTLLFLLIMLRPVFIYMAPLFLLFWFFLIKKHKKAGIAGLSIFMVVLIFIYGYCSSFQKQYGVFAISTVSDINQYMMLRNAGLVEVESVKSPEFKKAISESIQVKKATKYYFDEFQSFCSNFGYPAAHKMVVESIKGNFIEYAEFIVVNSMEQSLKSEVGYWDSFNYNRFYPLLKYISLPFLIVYLFLIYYFYYISKPKYFSRINLFIFIISIANLTTVMIASPNSWGRLIVPGIPILLILIGQIFSSFIVIQRNQK